MVHLPIKAKQKLKIDTWPSVASGHGTITVSPLRKDTYICLNFHCKEHLDHGQDPNSYKEEIMRATEIEAMVVLSFFDVNETCQYNVRHAEFDHWTTNEMKAALYESNQMNVIRSTFFNDNKGHEKITEYSRIFEHAIIPFRLLRKDLEQFTAAQINSIPKLRQNALLIPSGLQQVYPWYAPLPGRPMNESAYLLITKSLLENMRTKRKLEMDARKTEEKPNHKNDDDEHKLSAQCNTRT